MSPRTRNPGPATGVAGLALAFVLPGATAPLPAQAADVELMSVGLRARVGEKRVLGKEAPESFRAYDVVATLRLPWERYGGSGWGIGTRMAASAGTLQGADRTALVVSAIPLLALGDREGRYAVDMGAGLAWISEHRFAQQDFGGPLQGALTVGATVPLHRRLGVAYRFMHYSDWGVYGPDTIGVDFHMAEFSYRF